MFFIFNELIVLRYHGKAWKQRWSGCVLEVPRLWALFCQQSSCCSSGKKQSVERKFSERFRKIKVFIMEGAQDFSINWWCFVTKNYIYETADWQLFFLRINMREETKTITASAPEWHFLNMKKSATIIHQCMATRESKTLTRSFGLVTLITGKNVMLFGWYCNGFPF